MERFKICLARFKFIHYACIIKSDSDFTEKIFLEGICKPTVHKLALIFNVKSGNKKIIIKSEFKDLKKTICLPGATSAHIIMCFLS